MMIVSFLFVQVTIKYRWPTHLRRLGIGLSTSIRPASISVIIRSVSLFCVLGAPTWLTRLGLFFLPPPLWFAQLQSINLSIDLSFIHSFIRPQLRTDCGWMSNCGSQGEGKGRIARFIQRLILRMFPSRNLMSFQRLSVSRLPRVRSEAEVWKDKSKGSRCGAYLWLQVIMSV